MNDPPVTITRIASGTYRVWHEGRHEIVYMVGSGADRWIFWKGQVFRGAVDAAEKDHAPVRLTSLTAPMPARVIRILVQPGSTVRKGDTLVVLEAMKMELPVRAPANGKVAAVDCREGELVQADAVLIDLI